MGTQSRMTGATAKRKSLALVKARLHDERDEMLRVLRLFLFVAINTKQPWPEDPASEFPHVDKCLEFWNTWEIDGRGGTIASYLGAMRSRKHLRVLKDYIEICDYRVWRVPTRKPTFGVRPSNLRPIGRLPHVRLILVGFHAYLCRQEASWWPVSDFVSVFRAHDRLYVRDVAQREEADEFEARYPEPCDLLSLFNEN